MRNLKRALSLALAAAMLIGMMVIGASAADYKDEASVNNVEAVDVLTAVGIVGGDQSGNFNPTATLTRAEFAVMMANMLTGGKFDKTLFEDAATPFTDVKGHWGAAYIAYCYSVGVIAGTSATTFSPDATLTAAQASAILLMSLGYNQNNEFGANGQFSLNVTRWAQQAGLYDGLSVSANAGISRDNTAQLIYNALVNTTPVGYSTLAESYYTVGSSALTGIVYSGKDLDPTAANIGNAGNYYDRTLGYSNFGLKYGTAAVDAFQRTAHQWVSTNNANIGTYADDADLTYTSKPSKSDLESALNGYTFGTVAVYKDGQNVTGSTTINNVDTLRNVMDNGVLVEIFATATNQIDRVVIINTYLAKATDDYDADNKELAIDVKATGTFDATLDNDDFAVSSYEKDDYLVVTASTTDGANYTIQSVAPATVVEDGTVNSYRANDYVTVNGTQYKYNATSKASGSNALGQALMDGTSTYSLGEGYNLYLDKYGYVVGVEGYTSSIDLSNYVYIGDAVANGFDIIAKATFMDGTTATITISKTAAAGGTMTAVDSSSVIAGPMADGKVVKNQFYTFDLDKNKNYELTQVTSQSNTTAAIVSDNAPAPIGGVTKVATSSTVFITDDKVFTGVANTPDVASSDVHYLFDGNYLLAVYTATAGTSSTDVADLVYVLNNNPGVAKDENDHRYFVYDAIVDGQKTTLNANQDNMAAGLYEIKSYTDGYADLRSENMVTNGGQFHVSTVTSATYKDSVLTFNGTNSYIVSDDVTVYTIEGNTVNTNVSISSVGRQVTNGFDDVILVQKSTTDKTIVAVYLIK